MKISKSPAIRAVLILPAYVLGMFLAALAGVRIFGITYQQDFLFYAMMASVCLQALLTIIFRKFLDRKSIRSLGFGAESKQLRPLTGLASAISILGLTAMTLFFSGLINWHEQEIAFTGFVLMFVAILLVSFTEEMMYRGYILNNLLEALPRWQALALSAAIFSLAHITNPGQSPMAVINIFLGGLIMGLTYMHNRRLWFPFLFHAGWNLFQGPVMGFRVSGIEVPALFELEVAGPSWLTGGGFGLEGSLVLGIFLLIWFAYLLWYTGKIIEAPGN